MLPILIAMLCGLLKKNHFLSLLPCSEEKLFLIHFFFKAEHLTFIVVVIKPAVRMYYVQLLIGLNFDAMPLM